MITQPATGPSTLSYDYEVLYSSDRGAFPAMSAVRCVVLCAAAASAALYDMAFSGQEEGHKKRNEEED